MPTLLNKHSYWLFTLLFSVSNQAIAQPQALPGIEQWRLTGIMQSTAANRSQALISINGNGSIAIGSGELIVDGIYLQSVHSHYIQLQRGNQQAQLFLNALASPTADTPTIPYQPSPLAVVEASEQCQQLQLQVPLEELATLGLCPPPHEAR